MWWEWAVAAAVPLALIWLLTRETTRLVDRGVQFEQARIAGGLDYEDRHVRVATVHTRHDIIGLYHLANLVVCLLVILTTLIAVHVVHHW